MKRPILLEIVVKALQESKRAKEKINPAALYRMFILDVMKQESKSSRIETSPDKRLHLLKLIAVDMFKRDTDFLSQRCTEDIS